jgi:hypothetical protein
MTLSTKEIAEYNKEGKRRCQAIKDDGQRCRKRALDGSDFCFSHSPTTKERRKEISRMGGSVTRKPVLPRAEALTPERARELLSSCSELLLTGKISPGVARGLATLLTCDRQLKEHAELLKQLEELEKDSED